MRPHLAMTIARTSALLLLGNALLAQSLQQTIIATQLDSPVAMAIATDGRVFVTQQGGAVRIVRDDVLLPQPFATLPTIANDEEGLTGIALDPAFAQNGYVYLRVTESVPTRHNRIVRLTANGDAAVAGSAVTLFDLDTNQAHFHLGSALHFGTDGKLWFATGDNDTPFFGGNLGSLHGKVLRLNPDGTIPTDNPFYATLSNNGRAIYAYGIRNSFAFAVDPGTGTVFANDVGSSRFEEVNQIQPGGNYGWPGSEGPGGAGMQPVYAYPHSGPTGGCAITGGCFYRPTSPVPQLGSALVGKYLFLEYCGGQIRAIDPAAPTTATVLTTTIAPGPVDIAVAGDGSLYYLTRGNTAGSGGTGFRTGSLVKVNAVGSTVPVFTTYGTGCAGAPGVPYLRASGAPRLGDLGFTVFVGNVRPFAAGGLHLGVSNTTWTFGALPVDLTPIGMNGCSMRTSGDELRIGFAGAGTELAIALPLPNQPALLGATAYLQGVALDPAANPFGAAATAGTTVRIGN